MLNESHTTHFMNVFRRHFVPFTAHQTEPIEPFSKKFVLAHTLTHTANKSFLNVPLVPFIISDVMSTNWFGLISFNIPDYRREFLDLKMIFSHFSACVSYLNIMQTLRMAAGIQRSTTAASAIKQS